MLVAKDDTSIVLFQLCFIFLIERCPVATGGTRFWLFLVIFSCLNFNRSSGICSSLIFGFFKKFLHFFFVSSSRFETQRNSSSSQSSFHQELQPIFLVVPTRALRHTLFKQKIECGADKLPMELFFSSFVFMIPLVCAALVPHLPLVFTLPPLWFFD